MELTLESAFSTGGMVGHLAYLLLVLSMCMRAMFWLRVLVISSALVAIAYVTIWVKDPVSLFWETMLVTVNIVQILREWFSDRRARFTEEELSFVARRFPDLSKRQARVLLNLGVWVDGTPDLVLTTEGEPVENVAYISAGRVDIFAGGRKVGQCGPGNFVGEMSVLSNSDASATAIVALPSRYWLISSGRLRALRENDPEIAAAFQSGIASDLRNKIIAANAAAGAPG